jgi:FkbM family methyltransferase
MNYIIISLIILIILILLYLLNTSNKTENYQNYENKNSESIENNEYNINPPTKVMEHPNYGLIKCFDSSDTVCNVILNGDIWEEELFEKNFKPNIKENTTILDCGAFIGSHTLLIKKLNRNNDIFAFEMMPEQYKILQDNIKLNNYDNIFTFNFALGDKIDRIKLPNINYNASETNHGGTELGKTTDILNVDMIQIPLDFILPLIKKPVSFIKIDVEAYEINVMNGSKELITKYKPIIQIEISTLYDNYNNFINSDIWKYMETLGYKIKNLDVSPYLHDYLLYY